MQHYELTGPSVETEARFDVASGDLSVGQGADPHQDDNISGERRLGSTYVTFDLGSQTFAADVADVREILDIQPISPLPNAPLDLLGMIDLRGEGLAVMNLLDRLRMHSTSDETAKRIIVLDLGGSEPWSFGVVADRVRNVVEIQDCDIDTAPAVPGTWDASALDGVTRIEGQLVYLLSLARLLGSDLPGRFEFD
jgi:purine-binding chemotaxis protein CheW